MKASMTGAPKGRAIQEMGRSPGPAISRLRLAKAPNSGSVPGGMGKDSLVSKPSGRAVMASRVCAGKPGVKAMLPCASTPVETVMIAARARMRPKAPEASTPLPPQSSCATGAFSWIGNPSAKVPTKVPRPRRFKVPGAVITVTFNRKFTGSLIEALEAAIRQAADDQAEAA
jgi:hypothetical protein